MTATLNNNNILILYVILYEILANLPVDVYSVRKMYRIVYECTYCSNTCTIIEGGADCGYIILLCIIIPNIGANIGMYIYIYIYYHS